VLLGAALAEREALSCIEVEDMVRRALGFIARTGPATEQDRWEESTGINPFTLAICIAALVAGADLLPSPTSDWAVELADFWNSNIERWTSVSGTPLAKQLGVSGYYVPVLPEQVWDAELIPGRRLAPGRPAGSAMPLVWAHPEYIKLMVSRHLGHPVDRRAVWRRYQGRRPTARHAFWWRHTPIREFHAGARLAIAAARCDRALGHRWLAQCDGRIDLRQRSRLPRRLTRRGSPSA
jgi:hypothetical protein